jgi:hypothetical protein
MLERIFGQRTLDRLAMLPPQRQQADARPEHNTSEKENCDEQNEQGSREGHMHTYA